jgi:WD40 repeat protein
LLQTVGNGFACHHSTGLLYTTSEGNFEPGTGVVYEVDPRTHTATLILQGLWAADGLWLDQERHLLYVGLLFTSEVIVWDITSRSILRTIPKGIPGLLDDFCLDHTGDSIIGAAWTDNSIVMYNISTGKSPQFCSVSIFKLTPPSRPRRRIQRHPCPPRLHSSDVGQVGRQRWSTGQASNLQALLCLFAVHPHLCCLCSEPALRDGGRRFVCTRHKKQAADG